MRYRVKGLVFSQRVHQSPRVHQSKTIQVGFYPFQNFVGNTRFALLEVTCRGFKGMLKSLPRKIQSLAKLFNSATICLQKVRCPVFGKYTLARVIGLFWHVLCKKRNLPKGSMYWQASPKSACLCNKIDTPLDLCSGLGV